MKKIIALLTIFQLYHPAYSQLLKIHPPAQATQRKDTLMVKEGDRPYLIEIHGTVKNNLDVQYKIEPIAGDNDDIKIISPGQSGTLELRESNDYKGYLLLSIVPQPQKKAEATEHFKLSFRYSLGTFVTQDLIIEIESKPAPAKKGAKKDEKKDTKKKEEPESEKETDADNETDAESDAGTKGYIPGITYLNAYNFDFGNTGKQSNYVGHLNIFAPDLDGKRWGVNAGIMKINYTQNDSSINDVRMFENVTIKPFEILIDNSKYLRQINSYQTIRKNTVWSIYIQALYRITDSDKKNKSRIYTHGHFELVPSKMSSTTTITNITEDTAVFMNPAPRGFTTKTILSKTNSSVLNGVYGYFGLGFTFDMVPWDNSSLFFQPTIGITTNYPQTSSVDINSTVFPSREPTIDNRWSQFYLFRAYFKQKVNESATIIVGSDIRGLFPVYKPLYSIYAGLDLSLTKIVDLITGK